MDTIQGIVTGIPGKINKGGSSLSVWREIQITGGECPVFKWYCLYTKSGGFARAEEEWNRRSVGAITTKWATSGYQRCRN